MAIALLYGWLPPALREVVDRQFDAASVAVQIVDQRRFIGKIISADVHDSAVEA